MDWYGFFLRIARFLLPWFFPPSAGNDISPLNCLQAARVCPNDAVNFYLYTSDNPQERRLDMNHPENINSSMFMTGKPVKILLHGFEATYKDLPNSAVGPVYLGSGDYNVIAVDYGPLVADESGVPFGCYPQATANLPTAANCTARLIDFLVEELSVPLASFHLVGFSLGAHVAGLTANYLRAGQLPRVTGLDPAAPLYCIASDHLQLSKKGARFVDVVHTDAGENGKLTPVGHTDFYLNGCGVQPGCYGKDSTDCSHIRATLVFAESVNTTRGFWGRLCPSLGAAVGITNCHTQYTNLMGEYTNKSMRGLFRVDTHAQSPYAKGKA